MNWDLWHDIKALADILRGEIAVAEVRQTITSPADLAELRRMLVEARRFLATPEGETNGHEPQALPPPFS